MRGDQRFPSLHMATLSGSRAPPKVGECKCAFAACKLGHDRFERMNKLCHNRAQSLRARPDDGPGPAKTGLPGTRDEGAEFRW